MHKRRDCDGGYHSTPWPIQTNRWYVGVFNSTETNVLFSAQACYETNYPVLIPLLDDVPQVVGPASPFSAPPGPPKWFFYQFQVTNFTDAILFELYGLSGDADLVLQRDVPPVIAPYYDFSARGGTNPEQIVARISPALADFRGNWYLGVYNNESSNLGYTIRAAVRGTNGLLLSAIGGATNVVQSTSVPWPSGGNLISWYGVVGEAYKVDRIVGATTNPIATVVATTPCPTYLDTVGVPPTDIRSSLCR